MKRTLSLILALAMIIALTACGAAATPAATEAPAAAAAPAAAEATEAPAEAAAPAHERQKLEISVGCGTSSGVGYATASTIGALLQNAYPEYYTAKPEITTGGAESLRLLADGDVILCSAMADDVVAAYNGERNFPEELKGNLRYITSGNLTTIQIFSRTALGVSNITECAGMRVGIGSGTMFNYYWPYIKEACGLDDSFFKSVDSMGTKDAAEMLKNGQLDIFIAVTSVPNSTIQDVGLTIGGITVLNWTDEQIAKVIELQPAFERTEIDNTKYSSEGIANTVGVRNVYVTLADTDYQLVYDWVEAIDTNNDALVAAHPQAGQYGDHDNVLNCQLIPFHDAANDYYVGIGLIK